MNIQARLDPEILEAAKKAAEVEGISLSEYLRKLLNENVGNDGGGSRNGEGPEVGDQRAS